MQEIKIGEWIIQDSFVIDGKVYSNVGSLGAKYNELISDLTDLANKYNANLKAWVAEENECNAHAAQQVAQYNALAGQYNSLLRVANTPAYYPTYAPTQPQRLTCNTVFNTTNCYWQ